MSQAVLDSIPEDFGIGTFVMLENTDLNELSEDKGIRLMLRSARSLVKNEMESQVVTPFIPVSAGFKGNIDVTIASPLKKRNADSAGPGEKVGVLDNTIEKKKKKPK